MKLFGCKYHHFMSYDLTTKGHGFGVSQFTHFYDKINKYKMLTCPYVGSYDGEKGNILFKGKWILQLGKLIYIFALVSISDLPIIKYRKILEKCMDKAK